MQSPESSPSKRLARARRSAEAAEVKEKRAILEYETAVLDVRSALNGRLQGAERLHLRMLCPIARQIRPVRPI